MPRPNPTDLPLTLLQMAGAPLSPPPLTDAAVLLIDFQNEYVDGALALPGAQDSLAAAGRLLERARSVGAPVIHVAHKGRAGGLFDRDARSGRIADAVEPRAGEAVVEKGLPNAFAGTGLDALLKDLGRSTIVVAGFMTHMCVSSTVRAALDLGYRAVVVGDATATRSLPAPGGQGVIDAAALQAASLAALGDRFAIVVTAPEDLG